MELVLLGLLSQCLIGCAYPLSACGLYARGCVLALICQSVRGLPVVAGLGDCAGQVNGAQFSFESGFFKFVYNFLEGTPRLWSCEYCFMSW